MVIKSAQRFGIANERDVLRKFQSRTLHLRPLIDEIVETADQPAIVLTHLKSDLLAASNANRLSGTEIKYVSKRVLEALKVLHEDGYVRTGLNWPSDKHLCPFLMDDTFQMSKRIMLWPTMRQNRKIQVNSALPMSNLQTSKAQCLSHPVSARP